MELYIYTSITLKFLSNILWTTDHEPVQGRNFVGQPSHSSSCFIPYWVNPSFPRFALLKYGCLRSCHPVMFLDQCQLPRPWRCNMILLNSCRKCSDPWDTVWQATRCHHKAWSGFPGSQQPQGRQSSSKALWSACNTADWLNGYLQVREPIPEGCLTLWGNAGGLKKLLQNKVEDFAWCLWQQQSHRQQIQTKRKADLATVCRNKWKH